MTAYEGLLQVSALRSTLRLIAFATAFVATYAVLIQLSAGQDLDSSSFGVVAGADAEVLITNVYRVAVPILLVAACIGLGIFALVKRRYAFVVSAVAIVAASVLVSEVLKLALPRPDLGSFGYPQNTFPSGHVALALSSALALAVLTPPGRWHRPVVALAGVAAVGVSWASVVSFAHRPSDVVGGSLVVGFVASAVLWKRWTAADSHPWVLLALACATGVGVALVITGELLGGSGFIAVGPADAAGWFLLCVAPTAFVIGFAPTVDPVAVPQT